MPGKITVDPVTVIALQKDAPHKTISDLRSFLGLENVYGRLIRSFAETATPLYHLLRKRTPAKIAKFIKESTKEFNALRPELTEAPMEGLPRKVRPYRL